MDKIWYRNPSKSEVIDRCGGDEKKPNDHAEPSKSNAKKILKKCWFDFLHCQWQGTHHQQWRALQE